MCIGMIGGGSWMHEQEEIKRDEVMKSIGNLKTGKAAVVDGIMKVKLLNRCTRYIS